MKKLLMMITLGMLISPFAIAAEHALNSQTASAAIRCGDEYKVKVLPSDRTSSSDRDVRASKAAK